MNINATGFELSASELVSFKVTPIKAFLLGVAFVVGKFGEYIFTAVGLTLGYYYGVDLHNWLVSFK